MKRVLFMMLLGAGLATAAEVQYARVVKPEGKRYVQHPAAAGADFSAVFADFSPEKDGEKTDTAVFGAPQWLAVRTDGKTYVIEVNNTHGVFTIYHAVKHDGAWIRHGNGREIYHAKLYEQLRAAGLNVHTTEELKAMSKAERRQALSGKETPLRAPQTTESEQ